MGLFNKNNSGGTEEIEVIDGYTIGMKSRKIYHVPKVPSGPICTLPSGITGLTTPAIFELKNLKPQKIVVPGSCKKFGYDLSSFDNLDEVILQEGVEEVKCTFGLKKAVDIKLPTTIKKIGKNNYPVVSDLTLPNGVVEIEPMFASHDTNLISITIPSTLKVVSTAAFNQCKNLRKVVFSEGVETASRDAFRGTNSLCELVIPSTYNGTIDLPMEARSGSNIRGNSHYDTSSFEEDQERILRVKIKRDTKEFVLNIRRGDMPNITISNNRINIKCNNSPIIFVDCATLEPGEYDITNGSINKRQMVSSNNNSQNEVSGGNLEAIFQQAISANLIDDDFTDIGLDATGKAEVISIMREIFMKQAAMNIVRNDSNHITRIFNEAVRILKEKKTETDKGTHRY